MCLYTVDLIADERILQNKNYNNQLGKYTPSFRMLELAGIPVQENECCVDTNKQSGRSSLYTQIFRTPN